MTGSGLKKFAASHGFENKNGRLFGEYQGYMVTLLEGMGYKSMTIGIALREEDPRMDQIVGFIERNRRDSQITGYSLHSSHVSIVFHDTFGTMDRLTGFLDKIVVMLKEIGVPGADTCWYCGVGLPHESSRIQIEDAIVPMHQACMEAYSRHVHQERDEFQNEDKRYLPGLGGALLGGILGAIPWVIASFIGFFASILGFVVGWTSKKGYELAGGRPGRAKPWIIALVVVLSVFLAEFAAEMVYAYTLFNDEGITEFSIIDLAGFVSDYLFFDADYRRAILGNVALGLLFAFLGIIDLFRNLRHEGKGNIPTIRTMG